MMFAGNLKTTEFRGSNLKAVWRDQKLIGGIKPAVNGWQVYLLTDAQEGVSGEISGPVCHTPDEALAWVANLT